MHLASVQTLREVLGYESMQNITDAIESALDSSESILASILRTEFGQASLVDTFWVSETDIYDGKVHNEFSLSRGFVTSDGVVVKTAKDIASFSGGSADTITTAFLNAEKGVVKEHQTNWVSRYVQISYTAGFAADDDTPTQYDLTQVPGWLQEAAKLQAFILLANHTVIKEAEIEMDTSTIKQLLKVLVDRHMRYAPLARQPL